MFKKSTFVLFVVFFAIFSNVNATFSETKDVFEQINNYLMTGSPHESSLDGMNAKIFNREICRAGVGYDDGDYIIINWNNVIVDEIKIKQKYFGDKIQLYLVLVGKHSVADISLYIRETLESIMRFNIYSSLGILSGSHTKIELPINAEDSERVAKALTILFSKYCKGVRRKSAF